MAARRALSVSSAPAPSSASESMVSGVPRGGVPPNPGASNAAAHSPAAAQAESMSSQTSAFSGNG